MNPNSEQKRIAFGYERNAYEKIVIREGPAACVKLIYYWYLDGKSTSEIKEILEEDGIPSPRNGKKWSKQTIANILSNEHYVGSEEYPQIISEEKFKAVQDIKRTKK